MIHVRMPERESAPAVREKGHFEVNPAVVVVAVVVALAAAAWLAIRVRAGRRRTSRQNAIDEFATRQNELEHALLPAANATGKPRGLRWISCRLSGPPTFAVDRASGALYALVAVTVAFEAIEGGGMEEVEAVSNLRAATAVFEHKGGAWTTEGRVVFNLDPAGTLEHYRESLVRAEE
jgi:hypothetical protein